MHFITGLYKRGKFVIVEVSDLPRVKLCYEVVLEKDIRKGKELSSDEFSEIINYDTFFRAKNSAYRILTRRLNSEKELRDKLRVREYSQDIIDKVIDEMYAKNYLNDEQFTEKYLVERAERKKESPLKIKSNLVKKGIRSEIIENVYRKFYSDDLILDNVRILIEKKIKELSRKDITTEVKKRKIIQSLQYKGYSPDKIFSVLNEFEIS